MLQFVDVYFVSVCSTILNLNLQGLERLPDHKRKESEQPKTEKDEKNSTFAVEKQL